MHTQYLLSRLNTGCSFEICSCVDWTSRVINSFLWWWGRNQCTEHDATFTWSNKENMAECMFHSTWLPTVNHCNLMPAKCNVRINYQVPDKMVTSYNSKLFERAQKYKWTLTCVLEEDPSGNIWRTKVAKKHREWIKLKFSNVPYKINS